MVVWQTRSGDLTFPSPVGVGIVNVTEDSFFAGARSGTPAQAVADGLALAEAGFEMLDIGAVAARSGPRVPAEEETARLIPAITGLREAGAPPLTADTFSVEVARGAIYAGAMAINDISGGTDEMFELAAETGCGLVLTHIEGPPRVDREPARYGDVVAHIKEWFSGRIEAATARGVAEEQIAIDPGFDFDLGVADDLELLRRLDELHELERPLFVALSRKDFLGAVLAGSWEGRLPPERREWATAAAVTLAVAAGAQMLRLHDASALDAMRVAAAIGSTPAPRAVADG